MDILKVYKFNGYELPAYLDDNQVPWFDVKEITQALSLNHKQKMVDLPKDEKTKTTYYNGLRVYPKTLVNEKGLYRLIFKSRKPQAKQFQDWVFGEVLPSIRKHGAYISKPLLDNKEDLKQTIKNLQEENLKLFERKEQYKAYYQSVKESYIEEINKNAYLLNLNAYAKTQAIGQISKPLGIAPSLANEILEKRGVIEKYATGWSLSQAFNHLGEQALGRNGEYYIRFNLQGASYVTHLLKSYKED